MAFNSLVRRASASMFPRGIRSAAGVMSSVFYAEKPRFIGSQVLPFCRFSTANGFRHCINLIESGFSSQRASNIPIQIPDDFPFEIETNKLYHIEEAYKYLFRRNYEGEVIEIGADGYQVVKGKPHIAMRAHVIRGTQKLQFDMIAQPNQIKIPAFTMECTTYGQPMKAFETYLEIRGFSLSTMTFLHDCIWKPIPGNEQLYVIDYDYTAQQSSNVPDGFPFKIEDRSKRGKQILLFLQRQFEDEIIEAQVEVGPVDLVRPGPSSDCGLLVRAKIVNKDAQINLLAYFRPYYPPRWINVYEMSTSPQSGHLKAFEEFWEIRGIKPSTTNFMFNYFKKKEELESIAKGLVH